VARWLSVLAIVGPLHRLRRQPREAIAVFTWGALRGGILVALALSLSGCESRRQDEIGVVRSVWRSSTGFCEHQFRKQGKSLAVRALNRAEHLAVLDGAAREASEWNAEVKA
jgi:hypothetical protein